MNQCCERIKIKMLYGKIETFTFKKTKFCLVCFGENRTSVIKITFHNGKSFYFEKLEKFKPDPDVF